MMKRTFAVLCLTFVLMLTGIPTGTVQADGCYICRSGSSCGQYCRYSGKDTFANRKKCRKAGCKIGGTASCRSSANLKICTGTLPQPGFRYAGGLDLNRLLNAIK